MQVFDIFAGNILMLTTIDVIVTSVLGLVTALFFIFTYRETQLVLMDKELAYNLGLPVKALTTMMFVLLGIGVASALRLVGALLVDAIILLPAIAALRLASRFSLALVFNVAVWIAGHHGRIHDRLGIGLASGVDHSAVFRIDSCRRTCRA